MTSLPTYDYINEQIPVSSSVSSLQANANIPILIKLLCYVHSNEVSEGREEVYNWEVGGVSVTMILSGACLRYVRCRSTSIANFFEYWYS